MRVHLKGHFAPSRFACAYWREQAKANGDSPTGGRIINTVSESGLFGMVGQANYSAAKAGIASMTLVLAREMKKYGVTVNAVAPRARTRMTATVGGAGDFMAAKEGEYDPWHPDNVAPLVVLPRVGRRGGRQWAGVRHVGCARVPDVRLVAREHARRRRPAIHRRRPDRPQGRAVRSGRAGSKIPAMGFGL